jgi:hypothetical protein
MVSLEHYERRYRELTRQLAHLGFISPASLVERRSRCGKSECRCHSDPAWRHGPYHQWSKKVAGKTVSRVLSDDEFAYYREWVDNWHQLKKIVKEMEKVSEKANTIVLRQAAKKKL